MVVRIRDALIESIEERVSPRDVVGGRALMHGRLDVTLLALLEDGRVVRFRFDPQGTLSTFSALMGQLGAQFNGQEMYEALIIEDLDNRVSETPGNLQLSNDKSKEFDLGI